MHCKVSPEHQKRKKSSYTNTHMKFNVRKHKIGHVILCNIHFLPYHLKEWEHIPDSLGSSRDSYHRKRWPNWGNLWEWEKKRSHFIYSTATKWWRFWTAWAHRVRGYSTSRGRPAPESQRLQMRRQKLKRKPSEVTHTRSAKPSSPLPPSLGKVMSDHWLPTSCSLKCESFQNSKPTYPSNPSHCLCFI